MVKRRIIKIDPDQCNGCGLCVQACHEGAIGLKNGRAALLRDDYCDGLGDCLPACPTGAISFEEREALAYDQAAVQADMRKKSALDDANAAAACSGGPACPGSQAMKLTEHALPSRSRPAAMDGAPGSASRLRQWPVQIKLLPPRAEFFDQARLLIAADCAAYARADFHSRFMQDRVTLIGCPKLDSVDYAEKLLEILRGNNIRSVLVARMSVPCCRGLENAVVKALQDCGKMIPWRVSVITPQGDVEDS